MRQVDVEVARPLQNPYLHEENSVNDNSYAIEATLRGMQHTNKWFHLLMNSWHALVCATNLSDMKAIESFFAMMDLEATHSQILIANRPPHVA
jgi:hypothetical protein